MDSKGLRIGIVSGVLSSLIVLFFIQPALSFGWRVIVGTGGYLHQGYVDGIYRNAARIDYNPFGYITFMGLVLASLTAGLFWAVRNLERGVDSLADNEYARLLSRFANTARVVTWVLVTLCVLVLFALSSITMGIDKIATSFTQRLTVLAPAISDTEFKTFRARWASMKGQSDYDALVTAVDKRATELNVTLPPVRKP